MADAKRDSNHVPVALGVSNADSTTPLQFQIDSVTGRLLCDVTGGGSGTVTSVSVVTANGFAGTVATATTTPAITLTTSVTGILKGNGTAISAASAGTDYVTGSSTNTFTNKTYDTAGAGNSFSINSTAISAVTGTGAVVLANSPTFIDDITLGAAGGTTGSILFKGTTSGTVTVKSADVAGTWTLTLPVNDGDSGQVLSTDGAGVTSWVAAGGVPTTITVANEAVDATCFIGFFTAATGDLGPKSNANLTFDSSTGILTSASAVLTTADINGGTLDGATIGGAVAGAITGTTITANTGFMPDANDGAYLGQSGTAFADLFLADGGVINWNGGASTLTHSLNTLTIGGSGATALALGTNSLTLTGSIAATGARVTKGWFTDIESSNMPTVGGTAILSSLTAPTFTTIELGAGQTDTTLSRVSAGVVAIEGVNILTVAGGTLTGSITLGENTGIALDPAGSADGKYNGITVTATAGYAQTYGDLVYLDPTDSRWEKCDANAASGADGDSRGIVGIVVVAGGADGNACTILLHGIIRADAAFPAFTINNPVYVSETAGAVTQTQPTTSDVVIRVVGFALTADEMYFNPSSDYITHI